MKKKDRRIIITLTDGLDRLSDELRSLHAPQKETQEVSLTQTQFELLVEQIGRVLDTTRKPKKDITLAATDEGRLARVYIGRDEYLVSEDGDSLSLVDSGTVPA